MQAIVTGTIPIVGEGVNETIDFGLTNKKNPDRRQQVGRQQG